MTQGPLKYPQMAAFVNRILIALTSKRDEKVAELKIEDVSNNEQAFQMQCG